MAKEVQQEMREVKEPHWSDSEETQDLFPKKRVPSILVPIGCITTAAILAGGLFAFKRGDRKQSQYWMRARIISQLATVVIMGGTFYGSSLTPS